MTDVVVMCAIPQELALLRGALEARVSHQVAGRRADAGTLEGRPVVLAEAGIGKVNAAVVTTLLLERFRPSMVLFTGVAGGLDPGLGVGDVVIGERTIQHDAGVIQDQRLDVHQAGHVPFFNPSERLGYRPSEALLASAHAAVDGLVLPALSAGAGGSGAPPRIVFGTILTGDQFLDCAATRDRLHAEMHGTAVEMEGAAVAQAAEVLGVDCLVVRALSDLAGEGSSLDFVEFLDEVASNSATVIRALLRHVA
jgi:adenosylhomocysteine nucleosidase